MEDVGDILKELDGLVDGHVKHIGDTLTLVSHFEGLAVIAFAMTDLTGYLNVGQEVHLDGLVAIAATCLATASLYIEGEASWLVAAYLRFGQVDEETADIGEYTCIGGGVGAGCAP